MPTPAANLLAPKFLRQAGALELIARQVVEGFITGKHKSPYKGFSTEFAEHRAYAPGDNLRDMDWRVYGKTDRYYIKQYEEETNLRCQVVLDASGSMAYGETPQSRGPITRDAREDAVGKLTYGRMLSACLAYLLLRQSDAIGLVTFDTRIRDRIPPSSKRSHLMTMLKTLSELQPGGETQLAPVLHEVADRVKQRGMTILISDLFDEPESLIHAMRHLRYRRQELIVIQVLHHDEVVFPFRKAARFRNLEAADDELRLDPNHVRREYVQRLMHFCDLVKKGVGGLNADFLQVHTAEPLHRVLRAFLAKRMETA